MKEFFHAFKAQIRAANHEKRGQRPRGKYDNEQRKRYQDDLIERRTLGHGPHDGQLPARRKASHLIRIQCDIVAQYASSLLGGHLGHDGNVVE